MSALSELLLEVGTEELPASFVAKAAADLHASVAAGLAEAGLAAESLTKPLGTPRRLIVAFAGLPDRQEDTVRRSRGPAIKAAFNEAGEPTPALLGFCRGQGVDPATLERDEPYVWANVPVPGRATRELLAEILPKAILGLQFEKSMRWGGSRLRFARPLRWILASYAGGAVPFAIESVASGTQSRGHRFYSPGPFEAETFDALLESLRARNVEPDPVARRSSILQGIETLNIGDVEIPQDLLDENVYLSEWPTALAGEFSATYLELPESVLTTAMAKHERMFPVRDATGKLKNAFVFVRNGGEDSTVRRGAEWVLNARLADARFFFDEDKLKTLDDFLLKTEGILFQKDLGSVRSRADRLEALAGIVAESFGHSEEVDLARQAGRYAKADLASGLVGELASLQGVIGGSYAEREGKPAPAAAAIANQYRPSEGPFDAPERRVPAYLFAADALDKLAGYLGLGLEPTGSSDPYALRRAATGLIELALDWPAPVPSYDELLRRALEIYRDQGHALHIEGATKALAELLEGRYAVVLDGTRHDILNAAILHEYPEAPTTPRSVAFRARLLAELSADFAFVQTATRPMNIVAAAKRKGIEYAWDDPIRNTDESALRSPEGAVLLQRLRDDEDAAFRAAREGDAPRLTALLKSLQEPINLFFDATMVMSDDEAERTARLSLCHAASLHLLHAGDFTKLVQE